MSFPTFFYRSTRSFGALTRLDSVRLGTYLDVVLLRLGVLDHLHQHLLRHWSAGSRPNGQLTLGVVGEGAVKDSGWAGRENRTGAAAKCSGFGWFLCRLAVGKKKNIFTVGNARGVWFGQGDPSTGFST